MTKQKQILLHLRGAVVACASVTTLTACGNLSGGENAKSIATDVAPSVGCQTFESDFYDSLYKITETKAGFPSEQDVKAAFADKNLSPELLDEITQLYRLLALDGLRKLGKENADPQEQLATLSAMEIGDQTTPEKEELQQQIQTQLAKVKALSSTTTCSKPAVQTPSDPAGAADLGDVSSPKPRTLFAQWKTSRPRVIYGALKAMSTAYQSCNATQVPALGASTPDVTGITIVGKHPDGIGNKRLITNMDDLLKSHPYLQNYRAPASNCYDVTKNVPIYDYGGRPASSTGTMNFFANAGSGTAALGTDCSGYVATSLAAAGLRGKKATPMKSVFVAGVSSSMWMNPQKNGLTCFDYIPLTASSTMKAGDVIAKAGHVVMVDSVGADPFGIANLKSVDQCTLANVSVSNFNFTVMQDSPWKDGLGIQRSQANVYFYDPDEVPMKEGLLLTAVAACKAKFGTNAVAKNDKTAITRHSGSRDCMNATEIAMDHEACVASCPAL